MRSTTRRAAVAVTGLVLLAATGCGGEEGSEGDGGPIVVWSTDTLPDRVAATEAIIAEFTEKTGIEVELVGVAEDQFNQVLTSSAAAGDLPDVFGELSLESIRNLAANELIDTEANAAIVEKLGADTFAEKALELTRDGDQQLAVPDSSWVQLLYYRKDLFAAAGLDAPETYEDILAAAQALDSEQLAGFVGATAPGDAFTQQTFEHLGLANGCELVNDQGDITIDSDQCVAAFDFYGELVSKYSVPGAQDVDTVRASYFAGQAAMAVWSTYMLDELAGLRDDAKPSCPECQADPTFLAKNTGIVARTAGSGRRRARAVRPGDVVDGRRGVQHRVGVRVRRVPDERRLRRLADHRARGQVPGAGRHAGLADRVRGRLADAPHRRGHQGAHERLLRRPRCSTRSPRDSTRSPAGASPRARVT